MNTDRTRPLERQLTEHVIGAFHAVHGELGPGFLESVYENSLALALREAGISVTQQTPMRVVFRGQVVGEFRADLLIEGGLMNFGPAPEFKRRVFDLAAIHPHSSASIRVQKNV